MNIQELFLKGIKAYTNKDHLKIKESLPREIFSLDYRWQTDSSDILQDLYAFEILDETQYTSTSIWCDNFSGTLAYAIIFKGKCIGIAKYEYHEEEKGGLTQHFDYYWESKEAFKNALQFFTDTLIDNIFYGYHEVISECK